ncbi:MAG: ribosomal protein S18-alanine N-acetyltransferase [Jatrophihabitantaceae bacterium]
MTVVVAMRADHVDALMAYEHELFGADSWTPHGYRAEIADRNRHYLVLEGEGGELLGWAGLLVAADQGEILTVGVVPSAQRQGLARTMLAALYDEARRRGARELFLDVRVGNAAAIALYGSEGFTELGRRRGYYDHGRVDGVVMRKSL